MRIVCPHRKQSYASFRLEIFRSLFNPLSAQSYCASLLVARSDIHDGRQHRRAFQTSTRLSKQRGSRNVKPDEELRAFMQQQLIQDGHDPRPTSEVIRSATAAESKSRTREIPRPWTPHSERGLADLKALVSGLKEAANEAVEFEDEFAEADTKGAKGLRLRLKDAPMDDVNHDRLLRNKRKLWDQHKVTYYLSRKDMPESPVMRRLAKERSHKRPPTEDEISKLSSNPWASILASPVRHCQGTGTRLPRDLMVPWAITTRPADAKSYLVPHELAAVWKLGLSKHTLEAVSRKGEDVDDRHEKEMAPVSTTGETLISLREQHRTRPHQINMIPYFPLVETLTSKMMRNRADGQQHTGNGLVQRILPHRLRAALKEERHYAELRGSRDELLDLQFLQWQPEIAGRMRGIMRERLLTALESLARSSPDSIRHVPLNVLESGRISVATDSTSDEDSDPPKCGFTVVSDASSASSSLESFERLIDDFAGSFFLHINAPLVDIPKQPSSSLSSQAPNLLPQSVTLADTIHVPVFNLLQLLGLERQSGRSNNYTVRRMRQVLQSSSVFRQLALEEDRESEVRPAEESTSKYKLHLRTQPGHVPNQHFDRLGRPKTDIARAKLATWDEVNSEQVMRVYEGEQERLDHLFDPPALILVRPCEGGMMLAKEVWQLWRYIGGVLTDRIEESKLQESSTSAVDAGVDGDNQEELPDPIQLMNEGREGGEQGVESSQARPDDRAAGIVQI